LNSLKTISPRRGPVENIRDHNRERLKSSVTTAWNGLKSSVNHSVMNSLKTSITSAWTSIKTSVTNTVNSLKTSVVNAGRG
jgi:hypothetical protein